MKKSIFTLAIAAVMSLGASAAIPNTFNYQGVCNQKGAQIEVQFIVSCDGVDLITTAPETVTTNADGVFTTVIGGGDAWDAISWTDGAYSIKTVIDGVVVSVAPLQAVPYANVAGRLADSYLEDTVASLVEASRDWAKVSELAPIMENLEGLVPVIESLVEGQEAQDADIAYALDAVQSLIEASRNWGSVADIAQLTEDMEYALDAIQSLTEASRDYAKISELAPVLENLELLVPVIESLVETQEAQAADIEFAVDNVQSLQEAIRMKADVADLNELAESYESYTKDLEETLMESFAEAYDMISKNAEDIEFALDAIQSLTEASRDFAKVSELAPIMENLEMLVPQIEAIHETLDKHDADIEFALDAIQSLTEASRDYAKVSELNNILENLDMLTPVIETLLETSEQNTDDIAYALDAIQSLTEASRGYATIDSVNSAYDELKAMIQTLNAEVALLSQLVGAN